MDSELLQISCVMTKAGTIGNRSLRLTFDTQEGLSDEMLSKAVAKASKTGWLCFAVEREIRPEELVSLPQLVWDEDGGKSPSVRLRAALWRLHEQTKPDLEFESWYRDKMSQITNQVKEKLT